MTTRTNCKIKVNFESREGKIWPGQIISCPTITLLHRIVWQRSCQITHIHTRERQEMTNQDTTDWAIERLQIAQQRLELVKDNPKYSDWYKGWLRTRIAYYTRMAAGLRPFITKRDIACANVDERTGGICLLTLGHPYSCEVRWPGINMPGRYAVNGR